MITSRDALLAVAILFAIYIVWRFFQFRSRRRRGADPKARAAVHEKLKLARAEADPVHKALLFADAAEIARTQAREPGLVVALSLRALRSDPSRTASFHAIREVLAGRRAARRLERTCWRLLARIPPRGPSRGTYLEVWRALAGLYEGPFRHPARARAVRRLLETIE